MNNKKKILVILVLLFVIAVGCAVAAYFLPVGKYRKTLVKTALLALLAVVVFLAGLAKGR